jgi:hypothetical protein
MTLKVIAQTTSSILLMDPINRDTISYDKPTVVTWGHFFEARAGKGQIKTLASNLPDEASNEEFQEYLKEAEGKIDLAVASFISQFEEEEEAEKPTPPKKEKKNNKPAPIQGPAPAPAPATEEE